MKRQTLTNYVLKVLRSGLEGLLFTVVVDLFNDLIKQDCDKRRYTHNRE